jgi:methylphosphotriester-DNA--protein-cysteine methyltransferase
MLRNLLLVLALLFLSASLKAQYVYKTPSGGKYHLSTCRTVKNVSERITVDKAKELGLQPCKVCKPQNIYGSSSSPATNKAQGQAETVQCKGTTKAGSRCKHMTSIGNGYCFQHQPK